MNMQNDKTSLATAETATVADIKRIVKLIPHRYPMLLVDRVIDMHADERAIGRTSIRLRRFSSGITLAFRRDVLPAPDCE